jgi:hypothetical protein
MIGKSLASAAVLAAIWLGAAGNAALAQQASPPGWIADPRTGCKLWNNAPAREDTVTWSGACAKGLGKGEARWLAPGKPGDSYSGEYRDGKMNGRGVYTWANGDRYDGQWRDDRRHGSGVYALANGSRYEGEFRDNEANGRGVFTYADGRVRQGEWRDGKLVGP